MLKLDLAASARGLRIGIPWVLAAIAPLVMAKRNEAAYEQAWSSLPWLTQATVKYGLFLAHNIWVAVLIGVAILAGFQVISHHPRLTEPVKRMFMALHLSGVLVAMLVIFMFFLPTVLGSRG